ncbi:quinoprotein dehydrogenase-associated SoxYZ-like carrier [Sinorhizobium mexicanum]|uniref:Quinoprotein dehydrogenase-associated SoxYZ-like carrier n=1 Tax=Sinorhizobium mexicanum TaxID=375549 RepID=A0A859R2Z2_9HYPH|nr:quinoprotein dehydrogenase-associated SoxYZ-like carrier [Sinorhizobium mexicanum]MBP1886398.1 sulfur-oxidizing protein SoxY [Sinorhizobium mexicanum]QLL64008.1 quinoprotein dehydrogenase-associated SoxYZ-like carrier [Sinorhizobium mexicanum]
MKLLRDLITAACIAATYPAAVSAGVSAIDGREPERQARWQEISAYIFGDRPIEAGDDLITIEAPARAQDPALVPITVRVLRKDEVRAVHLVIDDNPSPYAAKISFGPAGDPSEIKLRVRVNDYTNVHAVAETSDGELYQTRTFVKASGGCTAPIGVSDAEALQNVGRMKMKFGGGDHPNEATLMIRHPNFSGMQINQVTRLHTPARYLDRIRVSYGEQTVFELTGDISLSSDPVIGFTYDQSENGEFTVHASDTKGVSWKGSVGAPVRMDE